MKKVAVSLFALFMLINAYSDSFSQYLDSLPSQVWGKKVVVQRHYPFGQDPAFAMQVLDAQNLSKEDHLKLGISSILKDNSLVIIKYINDTNSSVSIFSTSFDGITAVDAVGETYKPAVISKKQIGTIDEKYWLGLIGGSSEKQRFVPGSRVYMLIAFPKMLSIKNLNIEDYSITNFDIKYNMSISEKARVFLYDSILGQKIFEQIGPAKYNIIEEQNGWQRITFDAWINTKSGDNLVFDSDHIVKFVDSHFEWLDRDYSRSNEPYSAHVRGYFKFRNESKAKLLGVLFDVEMFDSFGMMVYSAADLKYQFILNTNEENDDGQFWYWEDGYNSPYSKIWDAVKNKTLTAKVEIKKAVFDDDVIIEY